MTHSLGFWSVRAARVGEEDMVHIDLPGHDLSRPGL